MYIPPTPGPKILKRRLRRLEKIQTSIEKMEYEKLQELQRKNLDASIEDARDACDTRLAWRALKDAYEYLIHACEEARFRGLL